MGLDEILHIYTSLFRRLGRKKNKQKYTSKQTTRNRKETQKQYLSNSEQVNADAVAHNYTSQIAYTDTHIGLQPSDIYWQSVGLKLESRII